MCSRISLVVLKCNLKVSKSRLSISAEARLQSSFMNALDYFVPAVRWWPDGHELLSVFRFLVILEDLILSKGREIVYKAEVVFLGLLQLWFGWFDTFGVVLVEVVDRVWGLLDVWVIWLHCDALDNRLLNITGSCISNQAWLSAFGTAEDRCAQKSLVKQNAVDALWLSASIDDRRLFASHGSGGENFILILGFKKIAFI